METSTDIVRRLGINEENLRIRRDFIQLGETDQTVLREMIPWAESISKLVAERFYDSQFAFGPTFAFFAAHSEKVGCTTDELRAQLERGQAGYIEGIFKGARSGWDVAYFAERLRIGEIHNRIDLPFKWYLGSYCSWRQLLHESLFDHFTSLVPEPEVGKGSHRRKASVVAAVETPTPLEQTVTVMQSLEKVFNLDTQAVTDSFVAMTLESLGMSIDSIQAASGSDRTEHLDQVKADIALLSAQAETMAGDVMDTSILDQVVEGSIGSGFSAVAKKVRSVAGSVAEVSESIGSVAASADQLASSANEISARTAEVASLSSQAVNVADEATTAVSRLSESSNQIDTVVSAIAVVAAQTNLLALNATIEAARAGDAGKGFSVVANEVKHLAGQTAEATVDIENQIGQIREHIASAVAAIDSIVESVKSVNELQTTMAGAVEEQSIAITELGQNLSAASSASAEIQHQVRLSDDTSVSAGSVDGRSYEQYQISPA